MQVETFLMCRRNILKDFLKTVKKVKRRLCSYE